MFKGQKKIIPLYFTMLKTIAKWKALYRTYEDFFPIQ